MIEITVPGVLRQLDRTNSVPDDLLPLDSVQDRAPDPTKPARGAFEAILLARTARPALTEFGKFIASNPRAPYYMVPISEIDLEESLQTKIDLIKGKRIFVMNHYTDQLRSTMDRELDLNSRKRIPRQVAYAYDHLQAMSGSTVSDIAFAATTLNEVTANLFYIAGYDYPKVLDGEPTARQMVDLVANSYETFVHLLAARHTETPILIEAGSHVLGKDIEIDVTNPKKHQIKFMNPGQYIRLEEDLRRKGEIQSQTIHCPFSIGSTFTEPFLDSDDEPVEENPLRYTFDSLVRSYIGA